MYVSVCESTFFFFRPVNVVIVYMYIYNKYIDACYIFLFENVSD